MKRIIFATLILGIVLTVPAAATEKNAEPQGEAPKIKRQVITKKVSGEVAGISGNFIAVDYKQEGNAIYELALTMDKNTKSSYKSLKEISIGDLVVVTYEETVETVEGKNPRTLSRLAKAVEFRRAAKVPSETGVLESR